MKINKLDRRDFTRRVVYTGAGLAATPFTYPAGGGRVKAAIPAETTNFRVSLNAYSFDRLLKAGTMTLENLLEFCAATGFDGVDITGYYFPGYPAVPADEIIYKVRRKAFRLGIDLGCTGIRNDFTWADPLKRKEEIKLVKEWILVAHKLGAPGLRIFSGALSKENFSWDERAKWIAGDIRECADFAGKYGVMLALQNHNDFLKTAEQTAKLLSLIDHEWAGLMLDIGSYHTPDPYSDIAANSKFAITWQIKEKVFVNEIQVDTDFKKVIGIVRQCGYKGYLPLETLGEGDPYSKVTVLLGKVKSALTG